jgi:hypothetical protein
MFTLLCQVLSAGKVSQPPQIALQDISACSPTNRAGSNVLPDITLKLIASFVSLAPNTINVLTVVTPQPPCKTGTGHLLVHTSKW